MSFESTYQSRFDNPVLEGIGAGMHKIGEVVGKTGSRVLGALVGGQVGGSIGTIPGFLTGGIAVNSAGVATAITGAAAVPVLGGVAIGAVAGWQVAKKVMRKIYGNE